MLVVSAVKMNDMFVSKIVIERIYQHARPHHFSGSWASYFVKQHAAQQLIFAIVCNAFPLQMQVFLSRCNKQVCIEHMPVNCIFRLRLFSEHTVICYSSPDHTVPSDRPVKTHAFAVSASQVWRLHSLPRFMQSNRLFMTPLALQAPYWLYSSSCLGG